MQDLPGAPGTARQGRTRTIVSTNRGGVATQPRAPGADRRLAMTAGAPGQHCLSAALQAPGADRRLAMTAGAPDQHRLSATQPAPGADAPLATTARAPGHYRLSAAPIATAPSPAGLRRLRQAVLPRVPANPRTLIYSPAHQDTALTRTVYRRATGYAQSRESRNLPLSTWWRGAGGGAQGEARHPFPLSSGRPQTTHQVHPAVQVPPHPRSCSTACTGFSPQRQSRAPPTAPQEDTSPPLELAPGEG